MEREVMRSAMRQALLMGAFLIVKFCFSLFAATSVIAFLMLVSVPFLLGFLQWKYRKTQPEPMRYAETLAYGFALFFYASLLLAFAQFLFYAYVSPDYLANLFDETLSLLGQFDMDPNLMSDLRANGALTAFQMVLGTLLLNTLCGFLLSLATSLFVRKLRL